MPSVASRSPTLSALSPRRTRSSSTAASTSPSVSVERVLALHHARARLVAELLDLLGGDRGLVAHFCFLRLVVGRRRRAAAARPRGGGLDVGRSGLGGLLGDRRSGPARARRPSARPWPRRPSRGASLGGGPRRAPRRGDGGALLVLDLVAATRPARRCSGRGCPRRGRRARSRPASAAAASAEPVPGGVLGAAFTAAATCASATSRGSPSPACVSAASASARLAASAAAFSSSSRRARSSASRCCCAAASARACLLLGAEARAALLDDVADRLRDDVCRRGSRRRCPG